MNSTNSLSSRRRGDQPDPAGFNLTEWGLKARISRENTSSRRYSASYIRSFREDTRSFRSQVTISSTASSPGYTLRDEIDPSTYSFTAALKALQSRSSGYNWECMSPDGFALNSKWNEAEKYISNPLSGEVPVECLSSKTLSGRSSRNLTARFTMSAPLVYSNQQLLSKPSTISHESHLVKFPIQEKKMVIMTRDAGTQSTPPVLSSSSPSPCSTPPIKKTSSKLPETAEGGYSPNYGAKLKYEEKAQVKETREEEETKRNYKEEKKKVGESCRCRCREHGGCLSWTRLWTRKRHRDKHKPRKNNIFFHRIIGC